MFKRLINYNKLIALIVILGNCFVLCACGPFASAIPELTDEQEQLVVEYATESLLKYDKNNSDKLGFKPADFVDPNDVIANQEDINTDINILDDTYSNQTSDVINDVNESNVDTDLDNLDNVNIIDNTEINSQGGYQELENALNLSNEMDFTYSGYEIKDSYPETLDAYFVMNASPGCKLVVLKFKVANITNDVVTTNVADCKASFRFVVNGITKNALTTMLANDLVYYTEDLQPGEEREVVLVSEYKEEDISTIDSVELFLKSDNGNIYINLE